MTPDPDHLRVTELTLHNIDCSPAGMPYERYDEEHHQRHRDYAHLLLNGYHNAGYTLTTTKEG